MSRSNAMLLILALLITNAKAALAITEHMFPNDALALERILEQLDLAAAGDGMSGQIELAKAMLLMRMARESSEEGNDVQRSQHIAAAKSILAGIDPAHIRPGVRDYLMGIVALEGDLDVDGAVVRFETAMREGLNEVQVAEQLATLYYIQQRYTDVIELLAPFGGESKDPLIHRTLAASYLALSDFGNARLAAARGVAMGGGTDVLILRAAAESNMGDYVAAERSLREVLEIEPGDRNAMMGLVTVLLKAGKAEPAKRAIEHLRQSYPNDPEVRGFLSSVGELS